jgi:hypothetical protein
MPIRFACLVSVLMVFALMQECEGHTDAAYIASRRMAPHLHVPHTLCFGRFYAQRSNGQAMYLRSQQLQACGTSLAHKRKRSEVGEYGAIRRAAM